MFNASVLKVMLASPGDVSTEREIAREVVHAWNAMHAERVGVVLLPVGWDTDAAPDMSATPQEVINRQVLSGADLVVAIFGARLGSPTHTAPSGTVEEIEAHRLRGGRVMVYFSAAPIDRASLDPTQYSRLEDFRRECDRRGLYHTFRDGASFRQDFTRHLAKTVHELVDSLVPSAGIGPSARPRLSTAAKELLSLAGAGEGSIVQSDTISGLHIEVGTNVLTERGNARVEAKWRQALEELEDYRLIEDRTGTRQVFYVTASGYEQADLVRARGRGPQPIEGTPLSGVNGEK